MIIDYKIEAIKELLDENCVLKRYYPLINTKDTLVDYLNIQEV